jgi:hypothetical protein
MLPAMGQGRPLLANLRRSSDMASQSKERSRRWWRLALLLFVVLPFVPEITILAVTVIANAAGCEAGSKAVCKFGSLSTSSIVGLAVETGMMIGVGSGAGIVAAWLAVCYGFVTLGWSRLVSRLLVALVVSLVFAALPYLSPALSLVPLVNENCRPNEGGVGPCFIYGGDIGSVAHETVTLPWFMAQGALIALGAFVVYVIIAVILRIMPKRSPKAAQ